MNFEKGLQLYKNGEFESALVIFNSLIDQEEGNAQYHLYRGRLLTRLGKGPEALADFDLLVTLEP